MVRRLFATDDHTATAILRLVLGVVFFLSPTPRIQGHRNVRKFD